MSEEITPAEFTKYGHAHVKEFVRDHKKERCCPVCGMLFSTWLHVESGAVVMGGHVSREHIVPHYLAPGWHISGFCRGSFQPIGSLNLEAHQSFMDSLLRQLEEIA